MPTLLSSSFLVSICQGVSRKCSETDLCCLQRQCDLWGLCFQPPSKRTSQRTDAVITVGVVSTEKCWVIQAQWLFSDRWALERLSLRADGVNSLSLLLHWLYCCFNLTLSICTSQVKADSGCSRCRCWGWGSSGLPARRALSGCQQGLYYCHLEAASRWWWKLDFGIFCGPVSRSSKNSESCLEDDGIKSEAELFFSSHMQMWGWNQPLDPVQWHTGEVCSFPRYRPGGGSFLPLPCACGKQQRHEPPVQSVRASGCHGPGWLCTDERHVAASPQFILKNSFIIIKIMRIAERGHYIKE